MSLPDAPEFDMWVLGRRAYYQQRYEQALAEVAARLAREAHYEEALAWAQRLAQSNPLTEGAHMQVMQLYALNGRREAALAHYEQYRRLLRLELRAEPGPAAIALHAELASGRPIDAVVADP